MNAELFTRATCETLVPVSYPATGADGWEGEKFGASRFAPIQYIILFAMSCTVKQARMWGPATREGVGQKMRKDRAGLPAYYQTKMPNLGSKCKTPRIIV